MPAARDLACSGGGWALLTSPHDVASDPGAVRVEPAASPDLLDGGFVVLVATGTGGMDQLGGVAAGFPGDGTGDCATLTSDGTRREGVIAAADVLAAVDAGGFGPSMRSTGSAALPGQLHDRYLQQRRMYVPVGAAAGVATLLILVFALFAYFRREDLGDRARFAAEWACFSVPAMGVGLLASGHLTKPDYIQAAVVTGACALLLPGVALAFRRRGVLAVPLIFGVLIVSFFAIEAVLGWPATLFTLLGGTALDGARFYGLPNAFIGLLLGSALFIAPSLRSFGPPVIVAIGLLAGLPQLGANIGAAVTIMFAAGMWIALTTPSWRGVAAGAVVGGMGLAVVIAAHGLSSDAPTHVTKLTTSDGLDPASLVSRFVDRLEIGIDLLARSPVGLLYLVATPVVLWLVMRPRGGWRLALEAYPVWRWAMMTILVSSIVAYLANDTGVSAVGMGFAMALGGIIYVPMARETDRIGST